MIHDNHLSSIRSRSNFTVALAVIMLPYLKLIKHLMHKRLLIIAIGAALITGCGSKTEKTDKIPDLPTENTYSDAVKLKAFTDAINANSSDPENYFRRGNLHLEMGSLKPAYDDALRASALDSNQGKYYLLLAKVFIKLPNLTEAEVAVTKAAQKGLNTPELFVTKGQVSYIKKDYGKAIEALNEALKIAESYAPAYLYKGLVYSETGDTAKAISNLQTAIEQSPDQVDAYNKLASINMSRKKFDLAKNYLASAVRFAPTDAFVFINLGDLYLAQRQLDTAEAYYKKAAFFEPELYVPYMKIGSLAAQQKKWPEAIKAFEKAVQYAGSDPLPVYYYARALENDGKLIESVKEYQKLIAANTEFEVEAQAAVTKIMPELKKRRMADSIEAIKNAIK